MKVAPRTLTGRGKQTLVIVLIVGSDSLQLIGWKAITDQPQQEASCRSQRGHLVLVTPPQGSDWAPQDLFYRKPLFSKPGMIVYSPNNRSKQI